MKTPPTRCVQCVVSEAVLDNLCPNCYRLVRIRPLVEEAARARQSIALIDTSRIQQEARLQQAIDARKAPVPRCIDCGTAFPDELRYAQHRLDGCEGKRLAVNGLARKVPARRPSIDREL